MNRRPIVRNVARAVAVVTAAAGLVVGVSGAQPVEAADGLPSGTLAQFVGYDAHARFNAMESSLGRPLDRVVTMTDHGSPMKMRSSVWGQFVSSTAYLPALSNRLDVTVTIPLAFGETRLHQTVGPQAVLKNLKQTTSGAYDAHYRVVAKNLIAAGYPDAVLRLGHEFDGTYYPWTSRDNERGYIDAFRHVQELFERESRAFRFEWAGMNSTWRFHARKAYPGDAYVDIIGLDIYYRSQGAISDKDWRRYEETLVAQRDFAIARGKTVSFPEWGRAFGDTDRFIRLMHGWFSDLPTSGAGSLEYQAYYNPRTSPRVGRNYDLDYFPQAKRTYLQLFSTTATGAGSGQNVPPLQQPSELLAVPTAPPPTTQPPAPAPGADVTVTPGDRSLVVAWSDPVAKRFQVRYRPAGTNSWEWFPAEVSNGRTITGLTNGQAYEVQVRKYVNPSWQPWSTFNATPTGGGSGETSTTLPSDGSGTTFVPATANRPALSVTASSGQIAANWSHPSAKLFQFRYQTEASSQWNWDQPARTTSRTVTGLSNVQNVTVQVRAYVNGNWRAWATVGSN